MLFTYSIIIPHFNDLIHLKKLVSTIPVRGDIEIIIIDDNSDAFPNINTFPNRNIQILLNNSGIQSAGACRNIGLKKATGKWLLFADSDDYFTENSFEILDKYSRGKSDVVYFSPLSIINGTVLSSKRHIPYKLLVNLFITDKDSSINYLSDVPWSKLISRSLVLQNLIFFEEVFAANDVIFSLLVGLKAKKINAVDEAIYCVTERIDSLTMLRNKKTIRCRFEVIMRKNIILYQNNLMGYQKSLYSIIKEYFCVLHIADFLGFLKLIVFRRNVLFPKTFKGYILRPSLLMARLLNRNKNQ